MTKEEFLEVPTKINLRSNPIYCKFMVIIPTTRLVGKPDEPRFGRYNAMIIVAIDEQCHPICKIDGDIDLLSLYDFRILSKKKCVSAISACEWRIDCLPTSGLLCFNTDKRIKIYNNGASLGVEYIE